MWTFESGVEMGRALEQIKSHETRLSKVENEVDGLKTLMVRAGLVLALWAGALALNLPAEKVGEFTGTFLRGLAK